MLYSLLADLVVAAHIGFVAYIVVGLALLLAGVWRGRAWVRNPWFRFTHLAAILVVVLELILDTQCPLSVLEVALRSHAGEHVVEATFLSRLMHKFLFGPIPIQVSNALYYLFALATAAAFVLAPPRRRRVRQPFTDFK
jgi:hypothetical protein